MASLKMTVQEKEFAEYARCWIAENAPPPPRVPLPINQIEVSLPEHLDYLQQWQRSCYEAGLVGADVPKEYGGHGNLGFQRIANQALSDSPAPFMVNIVGLSMMMPMLLIHGTEAQKRKFIPGALSGEEIWCQGFSEPNAGSDLANQQCFAERGVDEWEINGHKVWTSLGHFAKWMILLVRTSREHKYGGLTFFLCPVAGHSGVTVKPLVKMTGESGFNEVFLDDVLIPDAYRVDDVGKGWAVAMTVLTHERGAGDGDGAVQVEPAHEVAALIELAGESWRDGTQAVDDAVTRDSLMQRAIEGESLVQNARRARVAALNDHPERLALQEKVTASEFAQRCAQLGVEIAGAKSTLYKLDAAAPKGGHWPLATMASYGNTIAGGSNEILRNILGERILGLAKTK
jgi:alkylation response protein AidB-like acyl-CoA dehydrogenase